ncbi:hypothetical protein [Dehalogenimonas formicexedens]|nr:hypothetical protein [Dehalogenimonas formicexedens]
MSEAIIPKSDTSYFYQEEMDNALRFGDVVKGFTLTNAEILKPWDSICTDYQVNVKMPPFSVILTPCCSIGAGTLLLTPLLRVDVALFANPFLAEDLTRINRIMPPDKAVPPDKWEKIDAGEKARRELEGTTFAFVELFIYDKHASLPSYDINKRSKNSEDSISINHYMIDFRNIFKINCKSINSPTAAPLESKYLQLSPEGRSELRIKLARFFSRIPAEDAVALRT